jgi:Wadjet anti plasmid transformation system JetA-like protein
MDAPGLPPLFDRVPPALFGPLASTHASLYWQILARFYHLEFEGEPFFLVRNVAVEVAEEVLRHSRLWLERRDEILAEELAQGPEGEDRSAADWDEPGLLRAGARRLMARLEQVGWYHFEYRSTIGQVLNFYPYAARILETLLRIARDEQPVFQGYAHSIASLLKPEAFAAKPGVSLVEAKRHTLDLVRELKILDRNIYERTQRILTDVATAAEVLEESIDRYRQAVQANYHRLKTVDNLFKWRGEILHRLEAMERDAVSLEAAARWYAEQLGVDRAEASRWVQEDLKILRMQFETLPELIDDIDARNARFSGVALRKIMYLLRQDKRIEGQLQLIIDRLARDEAPDLEFDVFRCELLGDDFLYTPPRRRAPVVARKLDRVPVADTDGIRREIAPRLRRRFSRPQMESYVERLLGGRTSARLSEADLADDTDYVRLIYIASYGLDRISSYAFEKDVGDAERRLERRGWYGFPAGSLRRRRKGG